MQRHNILVIGASAGGVEALSQLVASLPEDLPAAIFVVLHVSPHGTSRLPEILNRAGVLKASHAYNGETIQHGRIYVAPPDHHLIVKRDCLHLARGPKENSCRPAIDVLFRSAATAYGPKVVALVLSGTLDDGTAGLIAVKQRGGISIVQNPDEALFDGMPRSAIDNVDIDYILKMSEMAAALEELVDRPVVEEGVNAVSDEMEQEARMAELELDAMQRPERPGTPSPYACPSCGGVLWELDDSKLSRFRCRTGHAFSTDSLLAIQSEALEDAFWIALRALEEKAALTLRLATQARERNRPYSAKRFQEQARNAQQRAALVRELLLKEENRNELSTVNSEIIEAANLAIALENNELSAVEEQSDSNHAFKLVVLCASAGGLNALRAILSDLSADFPAAIAIVQHIAPQYPSHLAEILSRCTALKVKQAAAEDVLHPGCVYIAPPNRHLLVNSDRTLSLSQTKLVHFVRPSADLLLESAAASFKQQAIAVILSGTGSDGAIGVTAIKKMGGITLAQDKATAEFFGMPQEAIKTGSVDRVVPLDEIAPILVNLVNSIDEHEQSRAEPGI